MSVMVTTKGTCTNCSDVPRCAKGLCRKCYFFQRLHGKTRPPNLKPPTFWNRLTPEMARFEFMERVGKKTKTGCWPWVWRRDGNGYGRMTFRGKNDWAHRVSYKLFVGLIPEGKIVMHTCDVGSCVNPKHLVVGTYVENSRDMVSKKRHLFGERSSSNKLSTARAVKIIKTYAAGHMSYSQIARRFCVSVGTIASIVNGRTWKHLERAEIATTKQSARFTGP